MMWFHGFPITTPRGKLLEVGPEGDLVPNRSEQIDYSFFSGLSSDPQIKVATTLKTKNLRGWLGATKFWLQTLWFPGNTERCYLARFAELEKGCTQENGALLAEILGNLKERERGALRRMAFSQKKQKNVSSRDRFPSKPTGRNKALGKCK